MTQPVSLRQSVLAPLLLGLALLATFFGLAVGFTPIAGAIELSDIEGHWGESDIQILGDRKVLGGYPDGTFRPEGRVSRAEFAAILIRSMGIEPGQVPETPTYSDVSPTSWAYPYIETAVAQNLFRKSKSGLFYPDKSITRLETMMLLAKAAGLPLPTSETAEKALADFLDNADVPAPTRRWIAAVVQQGIFTNHPNDKLLEPKLPISRAAMAVMTRKALLPQFNTLAESDASQQENASGELVMIHPGQPSTIIPVGQVFEVTLKAALSSETGQLGESVTATLNSPLGGANRKAAKGAMLIAAGSTLEGTITRIRPAGSAGKNGSLGLRFTSLREPSGKIWEIEAVPATHDGLLKASTSQVVPKSNDGDAWQPNALYAKEGVTQATAEASAPEKATAPGLPIQFKAGQTLSLKLRTPIFTSPIRQKASAPQSP